MCLFMPSAFLYSALLIHLSHLNHHKFSDWFLSIGILLLSPYKSRFDLYESDMNILYFLCNERVVIYFFELL